MPDPKSCKIKNTREELIQKYNRAGPRYTSYPPVPFWNKTPTEDEWVQHLSQKYSEQEGIDLYVHIPYCESLCYYCGCSRTITKDHRVEKDYVAYLLKEWELYQRKIGQQLKVNSLHFGGGTPTFLSPENLFNLTSILLKKRSHDFKGSIEVDPRTCTTEHLQAIRLLGFDRISLGIQDFDPVVQKTINRFQSPEMIQKLVSTLRVRDFKSINFDLIYGLPKQTMESIENTIKIVRDLNPDLIAFYSYAHLPDRLKNQRLIKEIDLPSPELKRMLFERGCELLEENGYVNVGMDHFGKVGSFLEVAQRNKKLHRNFMGYVDKKSNILIGLGTTSISDSSMSFAQNAKTVEEYFNFIDQGKLPLVHGHIHNQLDLDVQNIIQEIMCHDEVKWSWLQTLPFLENLKNDLKEFYQDGIVFSDNEVLKITKNGKPFLRNVAMLFDYHLREQNNIAKFSSTI